VLEGHGHQIKKIKGPTFLNDLREINQVLLKRDFDLLT
jgi:hypothetical protein